MWKTNKWVPDWVIKRAIAHLHAGPQPPCRCVDLRSRESQSSPPGEVTHRGTSMLRNWTCSELPTTTAPAPCPLSLYLKAKNQKYLMSSLC